MPIPRSVVWRLKAMQAYDRWRLSRLAARHPGLQIDPGASTNFAAARYELGPGARLRIRRGAVTERVEGALVFLIGAGASVDIGEDTWLRTELGPVRAVAFEGARIACGPDGFWNGCHVSAKREVSIGRHSWIGPGSRVFDSDQHDLDAERPEVTAPVTIGDHVWVASDVTVLRGVSIGDHAVVGARSLVTADVPAHTLAFGTPAKPRGPVGDRSQVR